MSGELERELKWEDSMVSAGRNRYYAQNTYFETTSQGVHTSYARKLIPELFTPFVRYIDEWRQESGPGFGAKYKAVLAPVTSEQLAYFTLKAVFDDLMNDKPLPHMAAAIGKCIEDEIKFQKFEKAEPWYVRWIQKRWEKDGESQYHRKTAGMTKRMKTIGMHWNNWSTVERVQIGSCLINCLTRSSDLITLVIEANKGKTKTVVQPSQDTLQWIYQHESTAALLRPNVLPTIIPPKPWEEFTSGGYYNPVLQYRVPQVKCHIKEHREQLQTHKMPLVSSAMTHIQATPYRVNKLLLDTMQKLWKAGSNTLPKMAPLEIPPCPLQDGVLTVSAEEKAQFIQWKAEAAALHRMDKERTSRCLLLARTLKTAKELQNETLYFPVQADFRGRLYSAVTGMSPQGSDTGRALIEFNCGSPLDSEEAVQWFYIHGANCYGWDKLSFRERIKHIEEGKQVWLAIASDPIGTTEVWANTDSPWKFLAWCLEFKQHHEQGSNFRSRIPIALDGTCNGLQHFSALLRDPVGAAATNLLPGDFPADIYQVVADELISRLTRLNDPLAKHWLTFGVTRKLTKRPVMTLPYGSTMNTCTKSIYEYIIENGNPFGGEAWDAALYLSPKLWDAISSTVVSARTAMAWLKSVSRTQAQNDKPMQWITPSGFLVMHKPCKLKIARVKSVLDHLNQLSVGIITDEIDSRKLSNGSSPNFVHSLDASHLTFVVNECANRGIDTLQVIHDSYGTHANKTSELSRIIREQFVRLYTEFDPLSDLAQQLNLVLDDIPAKGSFDITKVLESEYFFS